MECLLDALLFQKQLSNPVLWSAIGLNNYLDVFQMILLKFSVALTEGYFFVSFYRCFDNFFLRKHLVVQLLQIDPIQLTVELFFISFKFHLTNLTRQHFVLSCLSSLHVVLNLGDFMFFNRATTLFAISALKYLTLGHEVVAYESAFLMTDFLTLLVANQVLVLSNSLFFYFFISLEGTKLIFQA
jgi:hypothetical protein